MNIECLAKSQILVRVKVHNFPSHDIYGKLSLQRFWPCHGNPLVKTISTINHSLCICFNFPPFLDCGMKYKTFEIVLMNPFS